MRGRRAAGFETFSEDVELYGHNVMRGLRPAKAPPLTALHYFSVAADDSAAPAGTNWNNDGATGDNSMVVGRNASVGTNSAGALAMGYGAKIADFAENSMAIGEEAETTSGSIVIGRRTKDYIITKDPVTGADVVTRGRGVYIGTGVKTHGSTSKVALGNDVEVKDQDATAIGTWSQAMASFATALGADSKALFEQATALGGYSVASADWSTAVGYSAKTTGGNSLAVGTKASAGAGYASALGPEAKSTVPYGVALGAYSVADREGVEPSNVYLAGYGKVKNTVKGKQAAVSVGGMYSMTSTIVTRQIVNLAAGTEDTDAVNVAQLKAGAQWTVKDRNNASKTIDVKTPLVVSGDNYITAAVNSTSGLSLTMNESKLNNAITNNTAVKTINTKLAQGFEVKAGSEPQGKKIALNGSTAPVIAFDVKTSGKGLTVARDDNTVKYGIDGSKINRSNNSTVTNINTDITALKGGFTVSNAAGKKQDITLGGASKQNIKFLGEADKIDVAVEADGCNVLRHVLQKQRKKREPPVQWDSSKNQPYQGGPHEHYNRRNAIPPAFMRVCPQAWSNSGSEEISDQPAVCLSPIGEV